MPASFGSFLAGQEKNITAPYLYKYIYLSEKRETGGNYLRFCLLQMIILDGYAAGAALGDEGGGQGVDAVFCLRHGGF